MSASRTGGMWSVLKAVCLSCVGKRCPNCNDPVAILEGLAGICYKMVTIETTKREVLFGRYCFVGVLRGAVLKLRAW